MADSLPPPPNLEAAEELVRRRTEARDAIKKRIEVLESDAGTGRTATALATLYRLLAKAEDEVIRAEWIAMSIRAEAPEDLDEDTYRSELERAASDMAEDHLRIFVDVYLERHQMVLVTENEAARKRWPVGQPAWEVSARAAGWIAPEEVKTSVSSEAKPPSRGRTRRKLTRGASS